MQKIFKMECPHCGKEVDNSTAYEYRGVVRIALRMLLNKETWRETKLLMNQDTRRIGLRGWTWAIALLGRLTGKY